MKVFEIAEKLSLKPLSLADSSREVSGVYIGDLLSWVMGRAESGDAEHGTGEDGADLHR